MTDHYDVVVIGGGIHGAGVAQAAACAGHAVLLLERESLAAGTSSRSSKLIHGGLRYLETLAFGLVHESLRERSILLRIAPELVTLRPFHIPVYPETTRRPLTLQLGLLLYAVLNGLQRSSRFRRLERAEWATLDGLDTHALQSVFRYYDAQTDDAGLTRAVMQSAVRYGAVQACPAEFISATLRDRHCEVHYRAAGNDSVCTSAALVNAAGPWAADIATRITPATPVPMVELVQGTHLVLEGGLQQGCYYMEAPQDRRTVFLLPWGRHSLLGTTERPYTGDPALVRPLPEEESYLLAVLRRYFPHRSQQVVARFAGLRVLPASGSALFARSRETLLPVDRARAPRVVAIFGGKLTGYRATAARVIQLLGDTLPARKPLADTARVRLQPVD